MNRPISVKRQLERCFLSVKAFFLISFLAIFSLTSISAQADIRVLAAGGGLLGAPYATEEIIANGDVIGTVDRPAWSDFRLLTTADIIANYDVFVIPWNTDPAQYDFDWDTRLSPMLASGMGVIWEAPMTTGTAGSPLFTMLGNRYLCDDGSVCWIPDTPLNVLSITGITDGISGDFGSSTGYFTSWDPALAPFLDVDAVDLGTVVMGLYGQVGAGRIIISHNEQDTIGASTGTAAQVNAYNLMINKLEWVAASTVAPDPNLRVVPDTDGLTEAEAITAFNNAGFVIADTFYTTTNIDASGYVVSQDPQAGVVGFVGDPITLFVVAPQTGSPVTVPDVTGMTTANAESTLLGVGLERGQLTWGNSPTVPAGDVITQNPYAGSTDITTGWIVDLVESNGDVPGEVPYVKFLTQTEAGNAITASGYVVGDIATASHNVIASGSVIDQIPWPGATLAGGEAVSLVVSTGPAGAANISTPDVVGMAQATAESNITGAGLIVGTVSTSSSDSVPAGDVISQSPAAGTMLAAGAAVNLLVSSGPATISVPDVVNLPQPTAESTLTSAGLTIGVVTNDWSDTVAAGAVISQDPVAGTSVGIGSIVNLVISDGPEPALAIVPDVRNVPQPDAEASIIGNFLTVGVVTEEYSPAFPVIDAGNVISSNPSGGALVSQGTPVDLIVSLGPAPILTPDVLGLPQADAEAAIVAAGLVVGVITPFPSDTVPAGNVISQTPLVGFPVAEGTAVDLTVSSGPVPIEIIVPDVVGISQATAESTIVGASLTVGVVLTANSDTVPAGDVISQNPVAGSNVSEGSTVDLVVSLGPVAPPPPPSTGDYSYYVLNPLVANGSMSVVSLSDNNTITAGNTTLNLNQYERGTISSADLAQGTRITGTGPFDIGSTVNNTDMPVPAGFASTEFVLPHYRSTHLYYLMSPNGSATASINIDGVITNLNLTEGNVVEFNAGSSTAISGIVTSDNPILMAHRTSDSRDAYPVPPVATELWGIRSNNVILGALHDNTSITVYASNGTSGSYNLDAGDRVLAVVGSSGSEGAGNALHIVADQPIAAIQGADSDGVEATGFWPAEFFATSYGLPVNTQYVAVTCFDSGTTVTLNDSGSVVSQTCSASGNTPGKAFFGSTADGTNIGAGATIESDNPIYVYYEESSDSDEKNLLGNVSFGPVATPDVSVPSVVGLAQASAESAIAAAGLTLGNSTTANSATVQAGDVISQTPSAGTLVFAGDAVDIVVSIGPVIVNTPNVVGLSQTSAENSITASGLTVGTVTSTNSATVAAGDVISQNPSAGTQLNEGSAVDLVVSLGPVTVSTPDVVGLSQVAAESAITSANLSVGNVTTASSATVPVGNVISQTPSGGTDVAEGSNVDIVVSTGPAIVIVPNVVGSSQTAATNAITAAGLTVGTVTTVNSTTIAAGDVISQNPAGGTSLTEGSAVDLTVSLGPVIVSTPNVIGLSQATAQSVITAASLSVGTVTSANSASVPAGNVMSQNPTAGTSLAEGSNVDLVISLGPVPVIAPVADAGTNQIVNEGDDVNLDGTGSSDADGTIASYAWTQIVGPNVSLNGSNTSTPDFTAPEVTTNTVLSFTLVVTDNVGATDSANVNVTINNVLIAPTANAGGNQTVTEGNTVNLNGSASSDSNGSIVGYSWTQTAGTTVALSGATTATPSFTAPDTPDTLSFSLTVTDNDGQTASASVSVTVNAVVVASYEYYVLNPFEPNGDMEVVSLSDGNTISAGGTTLNLDNGQSGTIPASDINQGTRIHGTGPFDIGSTVDSSDMPVPSAFASTSFVIPHYRDSHLYYLMSPNATATVSIDIGGSVSNINLTQGDVVEFDAGGDNTISGLINADQPILVAHRAVTTTNRDAYVVPPPALEVWGVYSNNAIMGALEDGTNITVYASNGSSGSYTLDAGGRIAALVGSTGSEGAGNALHIVADKPIMVQQGADSDGLESVAFWEAAFHATEYALPVDTQYVAVACPGDNTTITLNDGGSISTQNCASSGNTPGKAYFGSTTDGTNINAGATISSDQPVYLYYEEASNSDEHNLFGNVSMGPVPVADILVPNVVGLIQASAESAIAEAGLTLGSSSTANSATVPAGDVISQSPSAGTLVFADDTVNIIVSIGPVIVNTPDVVGLPQTAATNSIIASGLTVGTITTTTSTTVAAGDVISQNPTAGTSLNEGSAVDLIVSSGPVIATTPDVVGLSQAAAESAITSANLSVGNVTTASSATVPVGNVISQTPSGGTDVAEGSNVDIVVSTGPAPVIAPVANAGTNQTVNEGNTLNLNGTGSSDSDGTIVSYAWSQTAGPNVGALAATATPSLTAPQVNADTVLTFSLTVTDNDGQTDTDSVNVTVQDVPPPPAGPVEVFYDSFENGAWNGLWTEDAQGDWFTNTQRATSGARSAEVDGSASDAQLISIPIDLQGGTDASITFNWYIESGLDSGEYLAFDVSTNGGASWTQHATLRGNVDSENTWHSEQIDLSGISSLRLRFRARMSWSGEDANVDEVRVTVQ